MSLRPGQVSIGVELEYLITKSGTPVTSSDYQSLIQTIQAQLADSRIELTDNITHLRSYSKNGTCLLEIKPDFAFNVVEFAFSPMTFNELGNAITEILQIFETSAFKVGIEITRRSVAQGLKISEIELAPWPRLKGYLKQFSMQNQEVGSAWYPAQIASTQVHLGMLSKDYFELASNLFVQEFIFAERYSFQNSFEVSVPAYLGSRHNHYDYALSEKYLLKTVPTKIYTSQDEYEELANKCPKYFDKDPISPVRDLSHVRARAFGTIEFRSTCTTLNISTILDIVIDRIAQVVLAYGILPRSGKELINNALSARDLWEASLGIRSLTAQDLAKKDTLARLHNQIAARIRDELIHSKAQKSMKRIAA